MILVGQVGLAVVHAENMYVIKQKLKFVLFMSTLDMYVIKQKLTCMSLRTNMSSICYVLHIALPLFSLQKRAKIVT